MITTWRSWLKRKSRPASRIPPRTLEALEELEGRVLPAVTVSSSFAALDYNQSGGYVPPDTVGAAGPSSYLETVNQTVALYSKAGGTPASTSLDNFWFTTGRLAHADSGSGLSDPIVVYDDQIGRFIVGDQDVDFNTHVSRFDFAVSKTSTPGSLNASDWTFYQVNTTEQNSSSAVYPGSYDADYPGNFGYNHDAFVFTLNMFGATSGSVDHALVVSVSQADLQTGVAQSALHTYKNDINDFDLRPAVMHDAKAGDPMWLVTEHGDNQSIDVIKMTNVLSTSAAFGYTNLAVTPYSATVNPLNPNGTVITNNIDSRIMKAAEWNNVLVASHSVGVGSTQDVAQWYAIDVSSGTPVLSQQGRVSAGNHTYITYPSVDINAAGQIGMTYMKSGNDTSTDYLSAYVTGRNPGDASGTMEASALVPAGKGQANYSDFSGGGRAGDLSGINVDPSDGSFWAANEFANTEAQANWGTAVAHFTLTNPLPSTDMAVTVSGPSSVTAGTNATYVVTITNNGPNDALGVVLTDTLPAGSTFVSMTQTGGTDGFTFAQSGGTVTETAGAAIASGGSDTFTLVVAAPANLANGANFSDTASVQANNPDPNTANNATSASESVVNNNPSADLSVKVSGPATANEGATVTYTITVTNSGSSSASGVTVTDTLPAILSYQSATASQGTFSVLNGVVTFSLGSLGNSGTATLTVTAQAIEDGNTSDTALVSSSTPDPNTANNTGSATTAFAEPPISVSGSKRTTTSSLTNFQTATFTHAGGVEPTGAFLATINWGDGTTSTGTITFSNGTYIVTGSHTYSRSSRSGHTITTSVVEAGNSAVPEGGNKFGDDNPSSDLVHLPPDGWRVGGFDPFGQAGKRQGWQGVR